MQFSLETLSHSLNKTIGVIYTLVRLLKALFAQSTTDLTVMCCYENPHISLQTDTKLTGHSMTQDVFIKGSTNYASVYDYIIFTHLQKIRPRSKFIEAMQ